MFFWTFFFISRSCETCWWCPRSTWRPIWFCPSPSSLRLLMPVWRPQKPTTTMPSLRCRPATFGLWCSSAPSASTVGEKHILKTLFTHPQKLVPHDSCIRRTIDNQTLFAHTQNPVSDDSCTRWMIANRLYFLWVACEMFNALQRDEYFYNFYFYYFCGFSLLSGTTPTTRVNGKFECS